MTQLSSTDGPIASQKPAALVQVAGFQRLDAGLHMIAWLRRGTDVRKFVVNDVEAELYAQDSGAQLLSVACVGEPVYETKVKQGGQAGQALVSSFTVALPLLLMVVDSKGGAWELDVSLNYQATGLDISGKFKLEMSFTIVGQRQPQVS